jgi:hypothetical protein
MNLCMYEHTKIYIILFGIIIISLRIFNLKKELLLLLYTNNKSYNNKKNKIMLIVFSYSSYLKYILIN